MRNDPEYLAARRRVIRENHPDRGGSDEQLIRALRQLDEQWDRKRVLRRELRNNLPSFIPENVAMQAFDQADAYVEKIRTGASGLRRKMREEPLRPGDLPRRMGRAAGLAKKKIGEEWDKRRK